MNLLSPFHCLKDVRLMGYGKLRFVICGLRMMAICLLGGSILAIVRGRQGAQTQRRATSVLELFLMMVHARFRVAWTKDLATTIRWQAVTIKVAFLTMLSRAAWTKTHATSMAKHCVLMIVACIH
jgi:hypothetical protein